MSENVIKKKWNQEKTFKINRLLRQLIERLTLWGLQENSQDSWESLKCAAFWEEF